MLTTTLKIDTREQELFQFCNQLKSTVPKYANLTIELHPLPLGDIIVTHGDQDYVIIERKTVRDLAASIKDGRYEEQSYRLNGIDHPNHNIIYLVEGSISTSDKRVDPQTIYSAMFSILFFKGFSVMRTSSLNETATVLCNMACKLEADLKKGKTPFYQSLSLSSNTTATTSFSTTTSYSQVVKKVKKENVNSDNIGEIMLC